MRYYSLAQYPTEMFDNKQYCREIAQFEYRNFLSQYFHHVNGPRAYLGSPGVTWFSHVAGQCDGVALDDPVDVLLNEGRTRRIWNQRF